MSEQSQIYYQPAAPSVAAILTSSSASFWLKDALQAALKRDPIDAANDAELLAAVLIKSVVPPEDIVLVDVVKTRILAGDPVYFVGPMHGEAFAVHAKLVDRLRRELGRAVKVVYGPVAD